ncbi:hypothetical protein ACF09C_24195 [Streptomyces sp. NPDC014870]|uniref:hypothetical protein n=1 Tax=Streptomyces sp. NPDC014870 TaxID=3364925 RepID=UPI003702850B
MSHQHDRAAAAPGRRRHATKRRTPGPRRLPAGAGVVGIGLLVAVVSGAFRSAQTGGAPTGDATGGSGSDGPGKSGVAPGQTKRPR